MDATALLKLLLDPPRLAVIGSLALVDRTVDEIAAHAGVDRRAAVETVAALRDARAVVEPVPGRYQLDRRALIELAGDLPQPAPADERMFQGMTAAEADVLGRFFRGERLTRIPTNRSKRLVVLERLALEFEPGRRYPESEVNAMLHRFHDDHATLRRQLVDEGLLDREAGLYWRSGGRVLV